jgi:hypothetical protein
MTNKTLLSLAFAAALCATAQAMKEARSPNDAWSMQVPETWSPAPPAAIDRMPPGVHSMWQAPEDRESFRDYLTVTILDEPTHVSVDRRDEFRAKVQAALRAGIENVEDVRVAKIADRPVYRVEGHLSPPGSPPLKNLKYFVPAGQSTYVFSFTSPISRFRESIEAFELMAGTIRMRDAAPGPPTRPVDWSWWITVGGILLFAVCAVAILIIARKQWVAAAEN